MAQIRKYRFTIKNKKMNLVIDESIDVASCMFLRHKKPVVSEEIGDFLVFHYEQETGNLVGFTIIHLREFLRLLSRHKRRPNVIQDENEWLRERAQQSIYEIVNNKKWINFWEIPEPFWHIEKEFIRSSNLKRRH